MPVPLFSIPRHIVDSIIQKLNLPDFINFHQSSLNSYRISNTVKTRFTLERPECIDGYGNPHTDPVYLRLQYSNQKIGMQIHRSIASMCSSFGEAYRTDFYEFPVRFEDFRITITEDFSEEFCIALSNFILRTNSSKIVISFFNCNCSPAALKRLVETNNVKVLNFFRKLSPAHLEVKEIANISRFVINRMSESDILAFDAPRFSISSSDLTTAGANQILKELLDGKRTVKYCSIQTNLELDNGFIFDGIPILSRNSPFPHYFETVYIGSNNNTYEAKIDSSSIEICKMSPVQNNEQDHCLKRKSSLNLGSTKGA